MGTELRTCGITSGSILHEGQGISGLLLDNPGGRRVSRAILGDGGKDYALCSNFDDIVRVVGGEKVSWRRNGTIIKDGELGP